MRPFLRQFTLSGIFIFLSLTALLGELADGVGSFSFVSERNGREVTVFYVKSASYQSEHPPVMVFHGMKRNPAEYRDGWIELAERHGLFVVCPYFSEDEYPGTVGYNLGNVFPSETELVRKPESEWSYHVPEDVYEYLFASGETTADGYYAFGHSAGSQFLHRKIAFAPDDRLKLAVAANAGWYTLPSFEESWPYGYKGTGLTAGNIPDYLASNLVILLGDQDIDPQHESLRITPEAMRQGPHRFARGHNFFEKGRALAEQTETTFNWSLQVVPGIAHDGAGMAPAAAMYMVGQMQAAPDSSGWILHLAGILVIIGTVIMIVRQYQTHATLFVSGFALLILAYVHSRVFGSPFTAFESSPTGLFAFDLFAIVKQSFSSRLAQIGLIIMAAGGFAAYLSSISASTTLVRLVAKPLTRIRNPYLLLALAYGLGQLLNIFVPSAAGLAMLLLVAMYPTLVKLGLRPAAVAAVIGTTACLDLGPASPASNVAAEVSGLTPIMYFVRHQLPVAAVVIPVIAVLHFVWQQYCDRSTPASDEEKLSAVSLDQDQAGAPAIYAILPVLPLVLLLVFSPLLVHSIQLDVVTAMLISLFAGIGFEAVRLRSIKQALAGIVHFFRGMGDLLAKVVTLIVAAETFATGVKATGLINAMIDAVHFAGYGSAVMTIVLVLLIGFTAVVTGSGNAALFSFANLVPGIARTMGLQPVSLMLPTQLSAGLFRSMSPVAGVIIAVSSAANVSPFAIIKRTSVPMAGGVITMLIMGLIL